MQFHNTENQKSFEKEEEFELEGSRGDSPFFIHCLAGSIAGLMEHVVIFPIDTIKTHMQASSKLNTISETVKTIYSSGGFQRFWKGSLVISLGCIPSHACYFSVYELSKVKFGVENNGFQFGAAALTGVCAAFFHDAILTPFDMLKQRMQLGTKKKCIDCFKNVVKSEGVISLYRSLPITFLMNAPFASIFLMSNENIKKIVKPNERKRKFLSYFISAGLSGSIASIITCPLDNIKTKLQIQSTTLSCEQIKESRGIKKNLFENKKLGNLQFARYGNVEKTECLTPNTQEHNIKYKNINSTITSIYQESGFFKGFYRGLTARVLMSAPSCAISWGSYEAMKFTLTKFYKQK